jgi:hypothetical protein
MKLKTTILMAMLVISLGMIQCSDDNDTTDGTGRLKVKMTDAPSDDASVKGTFITVSEVKVDGKTVDGFKAQTIEISAYQQGNAKLIIDGEVEAKTYSKLTLVLDYQNDEQGNSPGCYVLTDQGKQRLEAAADGEITVTKSFQVTAGGLTELVVDFDLRKSIVRDNGTAGEYRFVTSAELQNAVRLADEGSCGEIKGKINANMSANESLFVFAYAKGEYNESEETQPQGASGVVFAGAVTSAKVNADGSYQLSFLEEGDYEVHVASYEKDSAGKVTFRSMLNASSTTSGVLLNNIAIQAKSRISLNIDISILN